MVIVVEGLLTLMAAFNSGLNMLWTVIPFMGTCQICNAYFGITWNVVPKGTLRGFERRTSRP